MADSDTDGSSLVGIKEGHDPNLAASSLPGKSKPRLQPATSVIFGGQLFSLIPETAALESSRPRRDERGSKRGAMSSYRRRGRAQH